jgi:hypothetical protein
VSVCKLLITLQGIPKPGGMLLRLMRVLLILAITGQAGSVYATHLRAVQIEVEHECNTLRYKIYVTVYTNTGSTTPVHGFITFGDGASHQIANAVAFARPDLGPNVGVYTVELMHTYAVAGTYRIIYQEGDRSPGILNIPNSHDVQYCTYTEIKASPNLCNNTPALKAAPLDRACRGQAFFHNPAAADINGDSISYELAIPAKDPVSSVDGYRSPIHSSFYSNFNQGNEAKNGPPIFDIDPITGLMTWDAPQVVGPFNVAFKIIERRRNANGDFEIISTSIRDMQIVVEDCLNNRPDVTIPTDLCVEAGTLISVPFTGTDSDQHPVKIEVLFSLLNTNPSTFPATVNPANEAFRSSPDVVTFTWQTDCIHVRDQAYQVVVKITDAPPGNNTPLVAFKTWNIRVIAPAPKWVNVEPDLVKRTAKLSWEGYTCDNAESIQIWRRVGSFPFGVGACEAGISRYRGYVMIKELDPSVTEYTDNNEGKKLAMGATYCYRIVVLFPMPAGGKSYVSEERCVGPILADAPVITNVSVMATGSTNGAVEVKWLSPPDISKVQYPEPYEYEVYRANGFSGTAGIENVSGRISGTTFVDQNIDTENQTWNYRIVLYSKTQNNPEFNAIDTSDVASGVFLTATPGERKIKLTWEADVPWSNVVPDEPTHLLYRKPALESDDEYELIKTVDVTEKGFLYTDSLLNDDDYFCYKIVTRGTYGNSNIPILLNYSQQVCAFPINNLLPCKPLLAVDQSDCKAALQGTTCIQNEIVNKLQWQPQFGTGCRKDVVSYNIYRQTADGLALLTNVQTLNWNDENLLSYAFCYRVAAVDSKGGVGEMSDLVCNDNCPYYELPNVFSPNDDGCNDRFAAYGATQSQGKCDAVELQRCARFVNSVDIKILNRWGREVYTYASSDQNSIYVNWDGRDKKGNLLDAGVYFYVADVRFESNNPKNKNQRIKGWVQLVR